MSDSWPTIRASARGVAPQSPTRWMAPLGAGLLVGLIVTVTACAAQPFGSGSVGDTGPSRADREPVKEIVLPDVTDLSASQALVQLKNAGLTIKDDHQSNERTAGTVVRTIPPAGTTVAAGSTVTLILSTGPAAADDTSASALAAAVEANPDTFVGIFFDENGPVVVFGRGVDPDQWRRRLDALTTATYRISQCSRTRAELEAVQAAVVGRGWTPRAGSIALSTRIDPATCTVWVTTDQLTPAEMEAFLQRFGNAVTLDPTGHPERR